MSEFLHLLSIQLKRRQDVPLLREDKRIFKGLLSRLLILVVLLNACNNPTPIPIGPGPHVIPTPMGHLVPPDGSQNLRVYAGSHEPATLDPALAGDEASIFTARQLFSGLFTLDNKLHVVPDLAANFPELSSDGLIYTFTLRQGIRFASGQPIKASDFKYSLERACSPDLIAPAPVETLPCNHYLSDISGVTPHLDGQADNISGITVPDDQHLVISLNRAVAGFLTKLTEPVAFLVAPQNVATGISWAQNPDASGPFRLVSWNRGTGLELTRNDYYHDLPARLTSLELRYGPDPLSMYRAGLVDVATLPWGTLAQESDYPNQLSVVPALELTYIGLNMKQRPFDDPGVRLALLDALDRQKVVHEALNEKAIPAVGIIPPGLRTDNTSPLIYDLNRAQQALASSSYRDARNLPVFTLWSSGDPAAEAVARSWHDGLGINVQVKVVDWATFQDNLNSGNCPLFIRDRNFDYPDSTSLLDNLFYTGGPENTTNYSNGNVNHNLEEAGIRSDPGNRLELYSGAETQVINDAAIVPIYHYLRYTLHRQNVEGSLFPE